MKLTTRDENRAAGIASASAASSGDSPTVGVDLGVVIQPDASATTPAATRSDRYYGRKADERCTQCGRPASGDAQLCARHLRRKRAADRRWRAAARQLERAAGRCAEGCGRKSATYRCPVCLIRLGRIPTVGVDPGVVIQDTADGDRWRADANGWQRYRGRGRRGKPPAGANDDLDLRYALDAIERGKAGLVYARSDAVKALPRVQRREAMLAAIAHLELASRFLDEVVDRGKRGG